MKKIPLYFGTGDGTLSQKHEFTEAELKARAQRICKPCWELKYCPYGPLVEDFPLPPVPKSMAIDHHEYLKEAVRTGRMGSGQVLDEGRRKLFQQWIEEFDESTHPEEIEPIVKYMSCSEFGHLCPAFFVSEPFTETDDVRSQSRRIPRDILIRVIRRDNSMCQQCKANLFEREIEIDHIIPISKGGSTTESNLRVLCLKCNRKKSGRFNPK